MLCVSLCDSEDYAISSEGGLCLKRLKNRLWIKVHRGHSSMAERPLGVGEVPGSSPGGSIR
jgi:hypothetical protein